MYSVRFRCCFCCCYYCCCCYCYFGGVKYCRLIHPQNSSGEPIMNPLGKYFISFNLNGCRRRVSWHTHSTSCMHIGAMGQLDLRTSWDRKDSGNSMGSGDIVQWGQQDSMASGDLWTVNWDSRIVGLVWTVGIGEHPLLSIYFLFVQLSTIICTQIHTEHRGSKVHSIDLCVDRWSSYSIFVNYKCYNNNYKCYNLVFITIISAMTCFFPEGTFQTVRIITMQIQ